MDNETVSIIIPVYNVEKYLPKCIDSVVNQTYKNLKIILVDDGSTDNSASVCDEYAKRDERISVIHKENRGASEARNTGLREVRQNGGGGYIYFMDADDYIENNLVDRCVDTIKSRQCDAVVFNFVYENEEGTPILRSNYKPAIYCQESVAKRYKNISSVIMCNKKSGWSTVVRFYKADVINDNKLLFPESKIIYGEDLLFAMKTTVYQRKIVVIKEILYHYLRRESSLMHSRKNIDFEQTVALCSEFERFSRENGFENLLNNEKQFIFSRILFAAITKLDGDLTEQAKSFREKIKNSEYEEFIKKTFKDAKKQTFRLIKRNGLLETIRISLTVDIVLGNLSDRNIFCQLYKIVKALTAGRKH